MTYSPQVGDVVRAFHPRTVGVVKTGRVKRVGNTYVHIDFGDLWGGVQRVLAVDVLGLA